MPDSADKLSEVSYAAAPSPPGSILRNQNFLLLWCAYVASAFGDHLSEMALLGMQGATARDDSTRVMAILTFSFFLPYMVLGPLMGVLADRFPRKWIMIVADVSRALIMLTLMTTFGLIFSAMGQENWKAVLMATGEYPALSPWIYAIPLLVMGTFAAMFSPARAAMLPTLIRSDQIVRGNGLMNAMGPIAGIASYLFGAMLFHRYGAAANFRVDGLTFVASTLLLLGLRPPPHRPPAAQKRGFMQGLSYCLTHRRVWELILFTIIFWSAASIVRNVVPGLVGLFGGSIKDISYFQAALGIGLLSGAMLLAGLGDALKSNVAITWSMVGAGVAVLWLAAVSGWRIGQVSAIAGLFAIGVFGSGMLVSANALLQRLTPNDVRGRVFAIKDVLSMSGLLLATGVLAIPQWESIDRYVPLILCGLGVCLCIVGGIATATRLKRGRFGPILSFWKNFNDFYCWWWARARRVGICTIPIEGPAIVVANHNSTLDPFALTSASPNRIPGFMIAKEYTNIPVFKYLVQAIECVPVNRSGIDTASVKGAIRHLKAGKILGIFPQGRVQDPSEPVEVREGVGLLALRSKVPIIPAHISGIRYEDSVLGPFLRRQRALIRFGPPIDLSRWEGKAANRESYKEVAEHIMDQIMNLKPNNQ